jgi:hypothetical protein
MMSKKGHYPGGSTVIRTRGHLILGSPSKHRKVSFLTNQIPENPAEFKGRIWVGEPQVQEPPKPKKKPVKNKNKFALKRRNERLLKERRKKALARSEQKRQIDPEAFDKKEAQVKANMSRRMQKVVAERKTDNKLGKTVLQQLTGTNTKGTSK